MVKEGVIKWLIATFNEKGLLVWKHMPHRFTETYNKNNTNFINNFNHYLISFGSNSKEFLV